MTRPTDASEDTAGRPVAEVEAETARIVGAAVAGIVTQAIEPQVKPFSDGMRRAIGEFRGHAQRIGNRADELDGQVTDLTQSIDRLTAEVAQMRLVLTDAVEALRRSNQELTGSVANVVQASTDLAADARSKLAQMTYQTDAITTGRARDARSARLLAGLHLAMTTAAIVAGAVLISLVAR